VIKELKEICESKKGVFTVTLKANEKYVFNISGVMVKDGFVKVNWKEKEKRPCKGPLFY
jgi:hypothetical protein